MLLLLLLLPLVWLLLFHLNSDTEGLRSTKGCGASIDSCWMGDSGSVPVVLVVEVEGLPVKPLHRSAMSCSVDWYFFFF